MSMLPTPQNEWLQKNFVYLFISVWSLFAISYIVAVTFLEIPKENQRFADTILGFLLATALGGMFQYLLGTTPQSKAKDSAIKALAEK